MPKEVADFLEQDRKRERAQEKQDARHLSKSEFETVLSGLECVKRPVEDAVLRNLRLENLWGAIAELDVQGQNLLSLRYSGELTMEEIGQIYGISRMAVSKRLKKHDYILINDQVEDCVDQLHQIILSERCRAQRNEELINTIQEEARIFMKGDK